MAQIERDITGPVTVEQLKSHLHMYTNDFDYTLDMNIRAAVAKAESFINSRIWHCTISESVPFDNTVTVRESTAQIISVKVDGQLVNHTFGRGVIQVDGQGKVLEYTASVGYTEEDCPADIKMAILLIAAKYFNNPVDSVENLPSVSQHLLHPYRNYCI